MTLDVLAHAVELGEQRRPFVLATVVWRRGPSSGQQGSKAVILGDGTVRGWLGGACAGPTVVHHALDALVDGEPRLLFLGEADEGSPHEGLTQVAMACESDGALEVYLEPMVPTPQLIAVGRSPAVDAMAEMAIALGWSATVVDDGGEPDEHTRPEIVRPKLRLDELTVDNATAIVVATQGHYDDLVLDQALATDAGYVGLVASERRAEAVYSSLAARGHDEAALGRIVAPAGLDLGPLANPEIAVAVIADLVARRARGELEATAAPSEARVEAVDPVCGMTVVVADAKYHALVDGADHWFCAAGCLRTFEADPTAFI